MTFIEGGAIVPANNAIGSVAVDNLRRDLEIDPFKRTIWDGLIFSFIKEKKRRGESSLDILDVGCGVGSQVEAICKEAKFYGINPAVTAIDKIPGNVLHTRQRLSALGVDARNVVAGDVTERFPQGQYDFMTAFELIHWLTPDQITQLFAQASDSLREDGLLVISYATKFNNALLRDNRGELNMNRSFFKEQPIHRWSHACKTWMTFPSKDYIFDLGRKSGLKPRYYTETRNPYFPTCRELNIPLITSQAESSENAYVGFTK
jgi:SAM-dependent methyltransferase